VLLDFKTLSLMVVISSFLYAITIAFFALQANQYKGISLYMWGAVCAAIGFFATTLYISFPDSILLRLGAGYFLILACYFYCLGIARFLDFDFNSRWLFGLLVLCLAVISYFIIFSGKSIAGPLLISVYGIIFYSIACYFLWQRRHANFASSLYFVLFSLIFIILVFVLRCYAVIVYQITSPIQNQPVNNIFLLALFISGYLRNVGFIMMVSHRLYQDLRETAEIDFLTNIYNRRAIQQVLNQQFNQFRRYKSVCSLILLDIDYFKKVNDNYGHDTGDKVLQSVTAILKNNLRKTDILGRWGGEEFLVVLPNTNIEKALDVAEKLRSEIARNKIVDIACTISLGVKMFDKNDNTVDEAIKRADDALYTAKNKGRNCVVAFV
jgi:diguanylate cyclase (GGDEF)-like protein